MVPAMVLAVVPAAFHMVPTTVPAAFPYGNGCGTGFNTVPTTVPAAFHTVPAAVPAMVPVAFHTVPAAVPAAFHTVSCYHCVDEVREGSVQSNHSELTSKTSTHLALSALKWFEKVRGGSLRLNHSETVYRYPTHLVPVPTV